MDERESVSNAHVFLRNIPNFSFSCSSACQFCIAKPDLSDSGIIRSLNMFCPAKKLTKITGLSNYLAIQNTSDTTWMVDQYNVLIYG
jgi:hypothetical protein